MGEKILVYDPSIYLSWPNEIIQTFKINHRYLNSIGIPVNNIIVRCITDRYITKVRLCINKIWKLNYVTTVANCSLALIENTNLPEEVFNMLFRANLFTIAISNMDLYNNSYNFWQDLWVYKFSGETITLTYKEAMEIFGSCPYIYDNSIHRQFKTRKYQRLDYGYSYDEDGDCYPNYCYQVEIFEKKFVFSIVGDCDLEYLQNRFFVDFSRNRYYFYKPAYEYMAVRTKSDLAIFVPEEA